MESETVSQTDMPSCVPMFTAFYYNSWLDTPFPLNYIPDNLRKLHKFMFTHFVNFS